MKCRRCLSDRDRSLFSASELRIPRGSQWCRDCVRSYKRSWKEKRRRLSGTPIRVIKYSAMEVAPGIFKCRRCKVEKAPSEFSAGACKPRARGWCRECVTDYVRPGNDGFAVWRKAQERYVASGRKKVSHREWRRSQAGRLRLREYRARRRAAMAGVVVEPVPNGFEQTLLTRQMGRCAACRCELVEYHRDHIMPLALGGHHKPSNLQLLCPSCNRRKGAKHPEEFMACV